MTGIKICGIRDVATMQVCADLHVDWVGFVFYQASPRYVQPEQARVLNDSTLSYRDGGPERVGLFVKADDETIERTLQSVPLDILQIYDTEERATTIKNRFGLPTWLARGVASSSDLPASAEVNGYVIEAPHKKGDDRPGGLGRTFDWTLTKEWSAPAFWMLAGGLNPFNVREALNASGAPAVDVSSGVEDSPGHKSHDLIKKFVEKVRLGG
ncbi:N-(5'-phosphoribosyl)anthranilate isomerase [Gluconobacter oxydans]|uniref:phosphoribosylanthranilate isomerase n=1 Tax=Gluconobacter thailandicus TaxID=257438 RepID=UPI0002996C12|nr:phosphoribosylanthranilate isomerase [Gluconobacter thailandicus]AFW02315.1 N-(5'-phosphoribosyl)anthranilate isomerase [Gluconobacter oxydans H24]ANQ42163.1 N-(5'-phosphoribosyl)anthranilate isomerase [Gluconobacter oxydans]